VKSQESPLADARGSPATIPTAVATIGPFAVSRRKGVCSGNAVFVEWSAANPAATARRKRRFRREWAALRYARVANLFPGSLWAVATCEMPMLLEPTNCRIPVDVRKTTAIAQAGGAIHWQNQMPATAADAVTRSGWRDLVVPLSVV